MQNVGTVAMQNFVLIDILPFVGDTGVRDTNPRGSQWTPLLAAPITPPAGTTIYYSTSGNPCRGEVGGPVDQLRSAQLDHRAARSRSPACARSRSSSAAG